MKKKLLTFGAVLSVTAISAFTTRDLVVNYIGTWCGEQMIVLSDDYLSDATLDYLIYEANVELCPTLYFASLEGNVREHEVLLSAE